MLLTVPPRLDTFRLPTRLQIIGQSSKGNVALGIKSCYLDWHGWNDDKRSSSESLRRAIERMAI